MLFSSRPEKVHAPLQRLFGLSTLVFLLGIAKAGAAGNDPHDIPLVSGITIDGDTADWEDKGYVVRMFANEWGETRDASDFAVKAKIGWNKQDLLLLVSVLDDTVMSPDGNEWDSDLLQVFFAEGKGRLKQGWYRIQLADTGGSLDYAYVHRDVIRTSKSREDVSLKAQGRRTANGYCFEVAVPFANLDTAPSVGQEFGVEIQMRDVDTRGEAMYQVAWSGATVVRENALGLQRVRLSKKPGAPLAFAAYRFSANGRVHLEVIGDSALAGRKIQIVRDGHPAGKGKLRGEGGCSRFPWSMAHPRTHEEIELPVEIRIDGMPHRRIPLYDNPDRSDKWAGKFSNSRMPRFVFPPLHEKDLPGSRQMFFYSKSMDVVGAYGIYLPPGYEPAGKKRYPVLYVCHGRGESGYHTSVLGMWLHKAIVAGQIPPMLAVFVNGTARGGFRDDDETGLLIETMVREELIPHVDGHFATIPRPRGRALLGFSMGAYACWNFGLDSLTPFVALGSIGGGGEPDPALAKSFVKNGGRLALWIGEKDILLDHNRKLHGMLDAQGIEHVFKEVPGLEHRHAHYYRDIGNDILAFFSTAFAEK